MIFHLPTLSFNNFRSFSLPHNLFFILMRETCYWAFFLASWISAPDYWTARTRKWRFPFFERNNSSSVFPFSEFSNPSDFKVLWSRWQLQSFDIHVHVTYSLKLFFSLRSWCRCHPRFPLYRHTAVIQRLSRSSFKRIILYITFSPSPPPTLSV